MKNLSLHPVYNFQSGNSIEVLDIVSDHSQALADSLSCYDNVEVVK